MNKRSNKVFVTGSEGFIGSHLTEALVRKGEKVKALVLYNSFGSIGWLKNLPSDILAEIEIVLGDVRDAACIQQQISGCNQVYHLAALIGIPYSYLAPESYVDVNIKGTLNILQAARKASVDKLVHISTSEVYGSAQFVPMHEEHPLVGQSPYAATKISADQMAIAFQKTYDLPVAIARPFNTFGPRQSNRAVIPSIITQVLSGKRTISLGALDTTRDFNYCTDTVQGIIAIMESQRSIGEVINIGSGLEISISELKEMIESLVNMEVLVEQETGRVRPKQSEVQRLCADNTKIKTLTNWDPEHIGKAGLREGLRKTIEWFRVKENLVGYEVKAYVV